MSEKLNELLGADEQVVYETRQHWFLLVEKVIVPVIAIAVFAGGLIWLSRTDRVSGLTENILAIVMWILLAAALLLTMWRTLQWVCERLVVTTSKVVYTSGVINQTMKSTPLVKIDEVTLRRPLLGRILGYGWLEVENASIGQHALAGLEYLPKPAVLYQLIVERARHQRMLEGGTYRDHDGDGLVDKDT